VRHSGKRLSADDLRSGKMGGPQGGSVSEFTGAGGCAEHQADTPAGLVSLLLMLVATASN
jgi:hypothetical protein